MTTASQKIFAKLTQCGCSPAEAKSLINELLAESSCEQLAARRAADRARQRRCRERSLRHVSHVTRHVTEPELEISQQNQQSCHVSHVTEKNGVYISSIKKESKKGGVGENIEFAEFWKAYPKHVAKEAALKAFCKARKEASKEEILAGVKVLTNNLPQDLKFVPYPATWLNRKQWLDEPSHIASGPKWLNGIPGVI